MFDTIDAILAQLRVGEDSFAEFKEVRFDGRGKPAMKTESVAGEMVAFANAEGGCIFFGVNDDGLVHGIDRVRTDEVELWLVNIARNSCDPPIDPIFHLVEVPGHDGVDTIVMVVKIRRGLYVHRTKSSRYYKRIGTAKSDLAPVELARLMQQRGNSYSFDEQIVPNGSPEDLDLKQLESHFERYGKDVPANVLRNTRVLTEVEGTLRPTVAGLLAFGKVPSERLYSAYISAAVYAGTQHTSDHLVDDDQIQGSAAFQIDSAVAFVARHMKTPARKNLGRMDYPQYDLNAVYEAVVNAVAHRDYSISGSKIRIFLYDDRLEIYSPGRLPNSLNVDELEFRVVTRNQLLAQFLSRTRSERTGRAYLESRGEGVRKIFEASEELSGRRPVYRVIGEELKLTIWAQKAPR